MTLQDLIDELTALPISARTAIVMCRNGEMYSDILSTAYQGGEVIIEVDEYKGEAQ